MAKKNTDRAAFGPNHPFSRAKAVQAAHQNLFGKGAKVSGVVPQKGWRSDDELAMEVRPKAHAYKKDIALPKESKGRSISRRR